MKTRQLFVALALGLGLTLAWSLTLSAGQEVRAAVRPAIHKGPQLRSLDPAQKPRPEQSDRDALSGIPAGLSPKVWSQILGQVQQDRLSFVRQTAKITASDGLAGDAFAYAVAVDGETVLVGVPGDDDGGGNSGSAYIFTRNEGGADNWGQMVKITATDGIADDFFGSAVAVDGDTVVVGVPNDDDACPSNPNCNSGSAYIFTRNEGGADNWGQTAKITATDGITDAGFGSAVAVDGEIVVVGAYGDDDNGDESGSAYIFTRNEGGADNWGQTAKITATDGAALDWFGWPVAMDGDTVVVGAPGDDDNGGDSGSAYIFTRNEGGADNWGQTVKITASDGITDDLFGYAAAVDGDTVVVGAYGDDDNGSASGSAYIFGRNVGCADNWGQAAKIIASDGAADDYFAWAVGISGDTVVVGAYGDDDSGSESGSAYIFGRNVGGADNWGQTVKLTAGDAAGGEGFGSAVAADGGTVLIGAYGDDENGSASGSAYIFTRSGGTWHEESRPAAADGTTNDVFGYAVAVDGATLVVGARYDDDSGSASGSAYIFTRNVGGADNWGQAAKLTATDGVAQDWFGYAVAIDGDTVVVGANTNTAHGGTSPGSVYVFERNEGGADNWGQMAKITVTGIVSDDQFGRSVALDGGTLVVGASHDDDNGGNSGSVFIFRRNEGGADNWGLTAQITASDGLADDRLGAAVAIRGDTVVVGAEGDDVGVYGNAGSVYIFGRNLGGADNWGQTAKITATDGAAVDFFGYAVAIGGDTVVVGVPSDDDACPSYSDCNSGSAYIYARNEGGADNWGQAAKLTASDSMTGDQFGCSVALGGDTVIIGANGDDDNGDDSGSAYVFERNWGGEDNWGQMAKLTAEDGEAGDWFGCAVAIDGDIVVVGTWYGDGVVSDSGLAYIYRETLLRVYLPLVMRSYP